MIGTPCTITDPPVKTTRTMLGLRPKGRLPNMRRTRFGAPAHGMRPHEERDLPDRSAPERESADEAREKGRVDRRRLLQLLVGGSTVAVGGLIGLPVASYLRPLGEAEGMAIAAFPDDELGLWEAKQVVVSGRPVLVVKTDEGYRALSAVCTHLGCVVKWKKGRRQFFCPCHGARFDVDGNVLGGPAPRPLAALEVTEVPGTIVVRKA